MMLTLPPDYRPSEDEEFMNPIQTEYFRQKLLRRRAELLREADGTLASLSSQGGIHEADITDRASVETMHTHYQRAFNMLTAPQTRTAFDLSREPDRLRDQYGRNSQGQAALLARRLVDAGVPFVSCFSHVDVDRGSWDTHQNHDARVRELLPPADQAFATLLDDLHTRGMLDETLVIWMGEFGRTPRRGIQFSNNSNNSTGRDHWCNCYSVVLAGGGVRGGRVVGASDAHSAYPRERPVHVSELSATIFHLFGVDPRTSYNDIQGQFRMICDGNPVTELF